MIIPYAKVTIPIVASSAGAVRYGSSPRYAKYTLNKNKCNYFNKKPHFLGWG